LVANCRNFPDELAEKTQKTIRIHEIDPDAMEQLVNYAYSGDMLITEDNVQVSLSNMLPEELD